jgi:hypothetical protein
MQQLTFEDEATVQDRERLVKEYGVKSIIDLRTKYVKSPYQQVRRLMWTGLSTLNKPRSEMLRSKLQLQYLNLTTTLLDR